jgi:hypothetical protein
MILILQLTSCADESGGFSSLVNGKLFPYLWITDKLHT